MRRGGTGELYEARQKGLDRDVAIKTIRREHTQKLDWLERFRREGLVLAKLDHPHVVRVYDLDEYEGNHYLVMEWLAGESLQKRLERTTTLSEPELVDVLLQACAGMVAVQELGVQHRDLKPDNLFLCEAPDGSLCVKVIDFGIASGDGSCTATNVTMGTPQYMSPEHFRGTQYVIDASDQYSMGVIAYRCAAGRTPCLIRGNTIAELTELARFMTEQRYPSLASLRPELSPALTAVVTHMMASNPKQRFASMRAVGAALLPLADDDARGLHARWFRSESVSAIVGGVVRCYRWNDSNRPRIAARRNAFRRHRMQHGGNRGAADWTRYRLCGTVGGSGHDRQHVGVDRRVVFRRSNQGR